MTKLSILLPILLVTTEAHPKSLELVHVLFRHGDRTPDHHALYPNDPHINVSYHPFGYGQLTNAGKRRQYMLGKALHKRYKSFLGPYTPDLIDARSTNYGRTKSSLQLVLASLFPPEKDLVWEKRLKWQPVPFDYWPAEDDHILAEPLRQCERYRYVYDEFCNSEEGKRRFENYTDVAEYLHQHAGIDNSSKELAEMYFTLAVEEENGLALPNWTRPLYPDILRNLSVLDYEVSTATPELQKLASGFLFSKIISDTRQKIKNMLPQKMFIYSAHEYNIAYLMLLLGIYYPHIPPYGAYILIEIHNVKGVRGVKVFYQDYETEKPKRVKLPNCHSFCRFERFVKLYRMYLIGSDNECKHPR